MVPLQKISGRLGNLMFVFAFAYSYARRHGIDHYFQDPAFFEDHADEIKYLYREGIPTQTNMVAIHVRRGGNPINPNEPKYSKNPFYVNLSDTSYYEEAMELFPGASFLVFSDDIEWCKQQSIFEGCEFANGSEIEDMNLMASCVGHIIANSSYSWWAAYISPYTKKVVAPIAWYSDGEQRTKCPDTWIRI